MNRDEIGNFELKSIAKGGSLYFIGNVIGLGFNLIYNWYIANLLGAEGTGIISIILSTTDIIIFLSLFGLRRTIVRFVAAYREEKDFSRINGAILFSLLFVILLSTLLTAGLYLSRNFLINNVFHDPALLLPLRIISISIPFSTITSLIVFIAQAFKRAEYQTILENIVAPILRLMLAVIIIQYIAKTTLGAAYGVLAANILSALISLMSLNHIYPMKNLWIHKAAFVLDKLLVESWPLLFVELINKTQGNLGILMLGAFSTSGSAGIFKVSVRIAVFIRLFYKAINTMFSPIIVEAYSKKREKANVEKILKTVSRWGFTAGLFIFLVLFVFSEEILRVFGTEFVEGIWVLRILAIAELVLVFVGPLDLLITMTGYTKLNLVNSVVLGIVTATISYFLIPSYGPVGAAIGTAVGLVVLDTLHTIEVHNLLGLKSVDWRLIKPFYSGFFAVVVTLFIVSRTNGINSTWTLLVFVVLMGFSYGLCLLLLGLEEEDRSVLRQIGMHFNIIKPQL